MADFMTEDQARVYSLRDRLDMAYEDAELELDCHWHDFQKLLTEIIRFYGLPKKAGQEFRKMMLETWKDIKDQLEGYGPY